MLWAAGSLRVIVEEEGKMLLSKVEDLRLYVWAEKDLSFCLLMGKIRIWAWSLNFCFLMGKIRIWVWRLRFEFGFGFGDFLFGPLRFCT